MRFLKVLMSFSLPELLLILVPIIGISILCILFQHQQKQRSIEIKEVIERETSISENRQTKAILEKIKQNYNKKETWFDKENIELKSLGIKTSAEDLAKQCAAAGLVGLLFAKLFMQTGWILAFFLVGLFGYLPYLLMQQRKLKKRKELKKEFFYILNNISSQLSIGKLFQNIIEDIIRNFKMSEVMYEEFLQIRNEIFIGLKTSDCFYHMYDRTKIKEVKNFADNLMTFEGVGGNVNKGIQAQTEYFAQIKDVEDIMLIYENKLNNTLKVVTTIPLILLMAIKIVSPQFFGDFFTSLIGQTISICCFACMVFGVIKSKDLLTIKA